MFIKFIRNFNQKVHHRLLILLVAAAGPWTYAHANECLLAMSPPPYIADKALIEAFVRGAEEKAETFLNVFQFSKPPKIYEITLNAVKKEYEKILDDVEKEKIDGLSDLEKVGFFGRVAFLYENPSVPMGDYRAHQTLEKFFTNPELFDSKPDLPDLLIFHLERKTLLSKILSELSMKIQMVKVNGISDIEVSGISDIQIAESIVNGYWPVGLSPVALDIDGATNPPFQIFIKSLQQLADFHQKYMELSEDKKLAHNDAINFLKSSLPPTHPKREDILSTVYERIFRFSIPLSASDLQEFRRQLRQ